MDELSTLSPGAADAAATSARHAAAATAAIAGHVGSGVSALGGWYGVARDGYGERVLELQAQLDTLSWTATAGATLIEGHALQLRMLKAKLAGIDDDIGAVRRRLDSALVDPAATQVDWAELERWQASRERVLAEFDDASAEFATRMFSVLDQVSDRPRRLGEHVDDAVATVVSAGRDATFTALGWAWDRPGWVSTWKQVPEAALDAVEHPVETLADAVDWDDWSQGRYGAGAASLGMAVVGRGAARSTGRPGKVLPDGHRWARYLDADGNPLPQTVDELFAGVDLGRSEVFRDAHTVARHVDVNDEFLWNRLRTGVVEGGRLGRPPPRASRWTDEATAEKAIGEALRERSADVDRAVGQGRRSCTVRAPAAADVGVVWTLDPHGKPVEVPVAEVVIVLEQAGDGSWFILTAYPDVASSPTPSRVPSSD